MLAACSSEEKTIADNNNTTPTEPTEKVPIELYAGIVEGGAQVVTRAGAEDNHARHLTLTPNTVLALQVSGTWTAHSPETVIKATTATVGAETDTGSKHNNVSCSPVLYWDDYGTADPANASTGRTTGLTIYGAAINGKMTVPASASTTSGWTIAWTLDANQTTSGYIADKDLLISNNVKTGTGDGTYKFDARADGKLLEFTHAMSKITVNLKANNGFTDGKFAATPTVTLTSNLANQISETEWAYTTGTVNVTDGTVSSQATNVAITMAAGTPTSDMTTAGYTVTKEALVMPGSFFKKDANIIKINAVRILFAST